MNSRILRTVFVVAVLLIAVSIIGTDDKKAVSSKEVERVENQANVFGLTTGKIEVARTRAEKQKGLGDRDLLDSDAGMLFEFFKNDYHGIWMRGMRFPLDIIWLDENFIIVTIRESVSAESFPEIHTPTVPARYVLEVNAGVVSQNNIQVGDNMNFLSTLLK